MITERVIVSNNGEGFTEALNLTDEIAEYCGVVPMKEGLALRLLAEELLGLVKNIAGDFSAEFWIEEDKHVYQIHLESLKVDLNYFGRKELLSVSTTGNTAHRSLKEKIHEVIEAGLRSFEKTYVNASMRNFEENHDIKENGDVEIFTADGTVETFSSGLSDKVYAWSMQKYKAQLATTHKGTEFNDELEKSILMKFADDVRVGVRKDGFEIVIQKQFF